MGHWSINYLDDFGSAETKDQAWDSYESFGRLLQNLGAEEAKKKSVSPCICMDFLRNTLDCDKMTIEVSEQRRKDLLIELEEWENRKTAKKKEIQSLIGKLSFTTNCVRAGRIFLSRLIEGKGKEQHYQH